VTVPDETSFDAGQDAGTRTSACLARLAALQLLHGARWWNRWRLRIAAGALRACADELEDDADARCALAAAGRASQLEATAPGERLRAR